MDARSELLAYIGSALITIVGLFGLQHWYATYLDTHVVHASLADEPQSEELTAQREQERQKLASGKLPIDKAKAALAQGSRRQFPSITPKPSEDLSAMSGWMHSPRFKPYTPRATAVAPQAPGAAEGALEGMTAEGSEGQLAEPSQQPSEELKAGLENGDSPEELGGER